MSSTKTLDSLAALVIAADSIEQEAGQKISNPLLRASMSSGIRDVLAHNADISQEQVPGGKKSLQEEILAHKKSLEDLIIKGLPEVDSKMSDNEKLLRLLLGDKEDATKGPAPRIPSLPEPLKSFAKSGLPLSLADEKFIKLLLESATKTEENADETAVATSKALSRFIAQRNARGLSM